MNEDNFLQKYDVTDCTDEKGKCSNCGNCCINFIPISDKELKTIKHYVKKHNIKEASTLPLVVKGINLLCPFRNTITRKCNIYPVRPQICRSFICNKNCKDKRDMLINKYKTTDLRKEVFGSSIFVGNFD